MMMTRVTISFLVWSFFDWSTNSLAGYTDKVKIGMDVAASEFYMDDKLGDLFALPFQLVLSFPAHAAPFVVT